MASGKMLTLADLEADDKKPAGQAGGQVIADATVPAVEEPGWFEPGSKSEAAVRGGINATTLGLGKYVAAPINALMDDSKKSYWQKIKDSVNQEQSADVAAEEANPGSYMAGGLTGALGTGALGVGKTVAGTIAKSAVAGGIEGAARSGDVEGAVTGAITSSVLPGAVGALKGANKVASAIGQSGVDDRAARYIRNIALKAKPGDATHPLLRDSLAVDMIASGVKKEGIAGMNTRNPDFDPDNAWSAIKQAVKKEPPGFIDAAAGVTKDILNRGQKGGIGGLSLEFPLSMLGVPPGLTTAVTTAGSIAKPVMQGAKDYLTNREMVKALSPAAEAGKKQIMSKMVEGGANSAARFGTISTFLNQTSPEARAAMNEENPLNKQQ